MGDEVVSTTLSNGENRFPPPNRDDGWLSSVEKREPPPRPPMACCICSLIRTYLYLVLEVMRVCSAMGLGADRAIAAMTESRSSSESTGPLVSKSSCNGALASIAASVSKNKTY